MFINGQYHYICIAPNEWKSHKQNKLEEMMADSCVSHRKQTTCIHGAVTKISSVSTKLEYYNLRLWFKKCNDPAPRPDSQAYFKMLLNLRDYQPGQWSEMPLYYTCYVPNEWGTQSKSLLKHVITKKAFAQWVATGNIEGASISFSKTPAKVVNYNYQPWLCKTNDHRNHPHPDEYFGMRMKCVICSSRSRINKKYF